MNVFDSVTMQTLPQRVQGEEHQGPTNKKHGLCYEKLGIIMEIRHAAQIAFRNRSTVIASNHCGCYYCLTEFSPKEIKEWTDEEQTALCPFCSVDAVLADGPDCTISKEFLEKLHAFWF